MHPEASAASLTAGSGPQQNYLASANVLCPVPQKGGPLRQELHSQLGRAAGIGRIDIFINSGEPCRSLPSGGSDSLSPSGKKCPVAKVVSVAVVSTLDSVIPSGRTTCREILISGPHSVSGTGRRDYRWVPTPPPAIFLRRISMTLLDSTANTKAGYHG
jgi:hypothetical protein